MGWYNRECPTDSRDAYYEGRRSREYESNPYEHGRDQFYGSCRDASAPDPLLLTARAYRSEHLQRRKGNRHDRQESA